MIDCRLQRPHVAAWFESGLRRAHRAQEQAWPAIAAGEHVLLSAPTGSGKTLAAFLWALDRLERRRAERASARARASSTSAR